jgi:hypothetical protein
MRLHIRDFPFREAHRRPLAVALLLLGITGCVSTTDSLNEPLRVSVSAANYSQESGEELFKRITAPDNTHPAPPVTVPPSKPQFYVFLAVDYSTEVPLDTIYRELATPLAERGYFNVLYQIKAGRPPTHIDYLLRIYCGRRDWRTPTVRTDKVTWANDDLVSPGHGGSSTAYLIGSNSRSDSRAGMSPAEIANFASSFQGNMGSMGSMGSGMGPSMGAYSEPTAGIQDLAGDAESRNTYLVVVEAFRFEDVRTMKGDAPCIWSTLVATPFRQGLRLVNVLRPMARTAMPYFGATTDGLQIFEMRPAETP